MRIFISSTCYDLIDLRAELEAYFRDAGVDAILSDSLSSEFQTKLDANSIETCLANVQNCDVFVIILSNRYGPCLGSVGFENISATHLEYREAVKCGKPIHMFVRDHLEADYKIWKTNKKTDLALAWCKERRDWNIFELLKEHRELNDKGQKKSNWLWIFRDSTDLKRRLAVDFKEAFARTAIDRIATNGRIPYIEISGHPKSFGGIDVSFDLQIRNLGNVVAVAPVFLVTGSVNKWPLKSLAAQEYTSLPIKWAHNGGNFELSTRLSYSILDGQKFIDEGKLTITFLRHDLSSFNVVYELFNRKYAGAALEMIIT